MAARGIAYRRKEMRHRFHLALGIAASACTKPSAPPPDASPIAVASASAPSAAIPDAAPVEEADAASEPWDASRCDVVLGELLEGQVFRGVRRSPSRQAAKDRLDPKTRQQWDGRDHGAYYLLCRYAVRVNGHAFTYDHEAGQSLGESSSLDQKTCASREERAKVVHEIEKHTNHCADPHAGAYWGYDLVPATR